ncbi:MAG: hypothetical protein GF398_20705 [Chitinivibrionales bacterium]|nr:hypothetical protein [Chitinivibrionales bacterium]
MTKRIFTALLASIVVTGCYYYEAPTTVVTVTKESTVDTYVRAPYDVLDLIEPYVRGYFSPSISRYSEYLYPSATPHDPYDLPCYVKADFNGDYISDYAFLFTSETQYYYEWEINTRLIVVLSSSFGMEIAADIELGTVTASYDFPIEEYWAIGYVPAGVHEVATYYNGLETIETTILENDAFFLAELEAVDQSLFFADGGAVYEMEWEDGVLAKKMLDTGISAGTTKKIRLTKSGLAKTSGRILQWRDPSAHVN